jgi:membrane associated rhomboid family serine protease
MQDTEKPGFREPFLNVPPLTMGIFIALFVVQVLRAVSPGLDDLFINWCVLIPVQAWVRPWTILTYALLHFGWAHFLINTTGLLAFGSGVERFFNRAWYMLIFIGGILFGALAHLALFADSVIPLGGASAGISALFGAVIPLIATGRSFYAAVTVFIVTNIALGMMGMPDDPSLSIAWQAHLGGFIWGLLIAKYVKNIHYSQ